MKNYIFTLVLGLFCFAGIQAQSLEELKSMKADKEAAIIALQSEVDGLDKQIYTFPGWKFGGVGVAGFNALSNNDWYALGTPNASNQALSIGVGGFANLDLEKYFWRNLIDVNVARSAAFTDKDNNNTKTVALTNGLNLSSLFGYKIAPKWALSAEGRYTTSLLKFAPNDLNSLLDDEYEFALNSPGQATISAGLTWLPINNLVVIIHPLGYQQNWPGEFISSAGAKIGATYAGEIIKNVSWTSNLTAFVPYGGSDEAVKLISSDEVTVLGTQLYEQSDLVNWEWINGFSTSIWKGVGLAFNVGLKQNKQQADLGQALLKESNDSFLPNFSENPLQSYYTLGLAYTF